MRHARFVGVFLVLALPAFACRGPVAVDRSRPAAPSATLFPRAFVGKPQVDRAAEIERCFEAVYDAPPSSGASFHQLSGRSSVLLVAPHATSQIREGAVKRADGGTGSLAVVLHELTGAPALITTRQSPSDPNYYDDNEFKMTLEKIISAQRPALVLDLHASAGEKSYDIDFGTMNGESIAGHEDLLRRIARSFGRPGDR